MAALPEQQARQKIDAMLAAAGWAVQDGATLVTGNAAEFKRVKGLKVQEWHPA